MAIIHDPLIITNRLPSKTGYTWTLASRLGEMIEYMEAEFGQRDRSWTILGIEFAEDGPQIWFPGDCGHMIIQLNYSTLVDEVRALFQLAYQCIHLLDPAVFGSATVLEEGLATHFSLQYIKQFHSNYSTGDTKYAAAGGLAAQLLYNSPISIKNLRSQGIKIWQITASQLLQECPQLSKSVARTLATSFQDWQE
jgi:hypothetical protein